MKNFRKNQGITLIALVITIIVLLILAGISISMLTGQNGILNRAQEAKEKTEEAVLEEKIKLAVAEAQMSDNGYEELSTENLNYELIKDGTKAIVSDNEDGTKHILFLDEKKEYRLFSNGNIEDLRIDFDNKYVAPSSQDEARNNGVIGIGTDGNPVDMDLWNFCFDEQTQGIALNSEDVLNHTSSDISGYTNISEERINGYIPQYISNNNGKNYIAVTNLYCTFHSMTNLIEVPKLPSTVKLMEATFFGCEKLNIAPDIPENVEYMRYCFGNCYLLGKIGNIPDKVTSLKSTFTNCKNLTAIGNIGESVIDMQNTFYNCTALINAPDIPESVTNMHSTFFGCTNLKHPPIIHENVNIFINTFLECTNLQGTLEINANLLEDVNGVKAYTTCLYNACTIEGLSLKITGKSASKEAIVEATNNPNITLE